MIRVTVSYPTNDTSTFDHDYYLAKHIPLVNSTWKPTATSVDKGVNGPLAAAVHCTFENMDQFNAAMGDPGTGAVIADVANYTNIAPVIQVSEVVG